MSTAQFAARDAAPSWWPRVLDVLARDYPDINDKVWSTAIGENAAEQVAEREGLNAFARDIAAKARWVKAHEGEIWPAWSAGEILAVALVLDDPEAIEVEGWTVEQALQRLAGDIGGTTADAETWVEKVQAAL